MAIPVWLPYALQGGSMVASGVGNYLEGKNQESYSKKVMRMQQEASAKRQKAEGAAGAANIWFGLAGRQQMQPIYQKMPDIDPYESSGTASLFKGLGTGLGYASTAVSAYSSMSNLLAEQAREAGARAAAAKGVDALATAQPAILNPQAIQASAKALGQGADKTAFGGFIKFADDVPGAGSVLKPDAVPGLINNVTNHHSDVLGKLISSTKDIDVPEYKGILGLGKTQQDAYLEGYKTSLGSSIDIERNKLTAANARQIQRKTAAEQNRIQNVYKERELGIRQQLADLQANKDKLTQQQMQNAATSVKQAQRKTFTDYFDGLEIKDSIKESKELLNLVSNTPGISIVTDSEGVMRYQVADNAKLGGGQAYAFVNRYMRWVSNEAIHEGDIARLKDMSMNWKTGLKLNWDNFLEGGLIGVGTEQMTLDTLLSPQNLNNPRIFDNATIENMLNTALGQENHLKNSFKQEIANRVAGAADTWSGSFGSIGFNDSDEFVNFFKSNLEKTYGLQDIRTAAAAGDGTATQRVMGALQIGTPATEGSVPSQAIDASGFISTDPSMNNQAREYNARVISARKDLKKRVKRGKLTASSKAQFQQTFPGFPTDPNNSFYDVNDLSESPKFPKTGRRGVGYQLYQAPPTEEEMALSFLLHNNAADTEAAWMENADIANSFSQYQARDKTKGILANLGVQNALRASNYAWGNDQTAPTLRDPNTISDFYAPSTRGQSAQEAQAAMLSGFFGLGGLYTDTRNITRAGYPSLAEKYTLNRPNLGNPTLAAERQFQRTGQPMRSVYTGSRGR